jgi:hypothetical protein
VLILLSSLPKFRKGILAFIRCKELNTVDFQTDSPIQPQKKFEAQQSLKSQLVMPNSKKRPPPRVRFDSVKSEKTIFDDIDIIVSNDTTKNNHPSQKSQAIRWSKPTSQKKVTFAVETVIMTQKEENKVAKLIRFQAGHNYRQNFQIALLHRHNCADNFRRTSL